MRYLLAVLLGVAAGVVGFAAILAGASEGSDPAPVREIVREVTVREVVEIEVCSAVEVEPPADLSAVQREAWDALNRLGRAHEWECMAEIFAAESSWRPNVVGDLELGKSYGLPQRHGPSHGKPDLPWPVAEQVEWAVEYADERYGGMCEAAEARRGQGWW